MTMRLALSTFILSLLGSTAIAQDVLWARYPQNADRSGSTARRMDVDKNGNSYVIGTFYQSLTFAEDTLSSDFLDNDVFVAKYSPEGSLLWLKGFGKGSIISMAGDIKVDREGNVIILCFFFLPTQFYNQPVHDGILAKLDPSGNLVWVKMDPQFGLVNFNATSQFGPSSRLAIDSGNNIIVLAADNITGTEAPNYIYLFKFDSQGNKVWKQLMASWEEYPFGASVFPGLGGITLDALDNIIVVGYFMDRIFVGPYYLISNHYPRPNENPDIAQLFIAKFSPTGIFKWVKQGDYSRLSEGYSATTDPVGNIYLTGLVFPGGLIADVPTQSNGQCGFIAMLSPEGDVSWIRLFTSIIPSFNSVHPYSIVKDPVGGLYVTGSFYNALSYQTYTNIQDQRQQLFAMKLTLAGDLAGILTSDGAMDNYRELFHSVPDSIGNLRVVGTFVSSIHMGSYSIEEFAGYEAMVVMKIGTFPVFNDLFLLGPRTTCPDNRIDIGITPVPGASQYVWTLPPGATAVSGSNITTGSSISVIIGNVPGPLTFSVSTSVNGNDYHSYPLEVSVIPRLVGPLVLTGPVMVCPGTNDLQYGCSPIQNTEHYEWYLPDGISGSSGDSLRNERLLSTDNSFMQGILYIRAIGKCNDLVSNPLNVASFPFPSPPVLTGPDSICTNLTDETYTIAPVQNALNYTWSVPPGISIRSDLGTSLVAEPNPVFTAGYIKIIANGLCNFHSQPDSMLVRGIPLPGPAVQMDGPALLCVGERGVTYHVNSINQATHYVWTIPDCFEAPNVVTTTSPSIALNVMRADHGDILVGAVNRCNQPGSPTNLAVIAFSPLPVPQISAELCGNHVSVVGTDSLSHIQWYRDQSLLPDTLRAIDVIDSGYYQVQASNFCGAVFSNRVMVHPFVASNLFIPNVMTPNGDGKNERFEIDPALVGSSMLILDRWGSTVFRTDSYQNDWTGSGLDPGVYYYLLRNACQDSPFKGWVEILR